MEAIQTTRMSTRGQVIIPKSIRDKAGFEKEELFAVYAVDDAVYLQRINRERLMQDLRKVEAKVKKRYTPAVIDAEIKATRRSRH